MIMKDLIDEKSIQAMAEMETESEIKNAYIVALNQMAKSSCLNDTTSK